MSMTSPDQPPRDTRTPYADAAEHYWTAGWRGILPLPAHAKKHPPKGYTGNDGTWPSFADVYAWAEDRPDGNICLRLPPDVIGIDVDHYGNKPGGLVLQQHETDLGTLPATWRTTSRDDGISGIRLYRIPAGLRWPGVLGPGIETVRHEHRYAVVWPSIHPDTGSTYRWINSDGHTAIGEIPGVDDLPDLPDQWVAHFTGGLLADDTPKTALTDQATREWLNTRADGAPCKHTRHALATGLPAITTGESRHDATLKLTNRLIWTAGEGHTGALTALADVRALFLKAIAGDRADGEAETEWDRMIVGAVARAAHAHPTPGADPCDLSILTGKNQPCQTPTSTTKTGTPSSTTSTASPQPSSESSAHSTAATDTPSTTQPNSAASSHTATADDAEDQPTTEHTSWWPVDLTDALAGITEPPPAHLTRDDGHAAFYPGRINGIIGPSESGKTWIAMHAAHQTITRTDRVTILDFEDSAPGVIGRLLALGLTTDQIRDHVAYIGPNQRYNQLLATGDDLTEHLATWQPSLILLDGFNAAMAIQGLNLLDNTEATMFFQDLLRPLAESGATVIYVDHTPKDKDNTSAGGIGAQAKRAMTSGCTLKVDVIKAFGKGQSGKLRLYVDKDRQGDVRGTSAPAKTGHWFGDFNVTGHPDGTLDVTVHAPDGLDADHTDEYEFRPTHLMERISERLAAAPGGLTRTKIIKSGGNEKALGVGLDILEREGYVTASQATGQGGTRSIYTLTKPYSEALDGLISGDSPKCRQSVAKVSPGDGSEDPSGKCRQPAPTPTGAGDTSAASAGGTSTTPDDSKCRQDDEAFCKSCGTDITEDLKFAPGLFTCRHCRKPINGSAR